MDDQDNHITVSKPQSNYTGVCYGFGDGDRRKTLSEEAFNKQFARDAKVVEPGSFAFQNDRDSMLVVTVGAGIAFTVYDDVLGIGALGYVLLTPACHEVFPKFDDIAPEQLEKVVAPIEGAIGEIKKNGAGKNRIRVRLFGGANLAGDTNDSGTRNYVFVKEYLSRKGIKIMGEDIGGNHIRRIHFVPDEGAITRFQLKREDDLAALSFSEQKYFSS